MTYARRSTVLSRLWGPALVIVLAACGGAGPTVRTDPNRTASTETRSEPGTPRTSLTATELETLRTNVGLVTAGSDRPQVLAALGVDLEGLAVTGTGPSHAATEIYGLGGSNVLWLTWDARDLEDVVLVRAVVFDQDRDPLPEAPPWPPPARRPAR